jgi:DNA-binding NarL/FixJ family response regulator
MALQSWSTLPIGTTDCTDSHFPTLAEREVANQSAEGIAPGVSIRCVVADDHPAVLDAVVRVLESEEDVDVVGRSRDGEHALRLLIQEQPRVALLDIRMPGLGGIDVARRLAEVDSPTSVILYTGYGDRGLLLEALDIGVRGFLLKEAPLDDLVRAIRIVAGGGSYIDPALAGVLAGPSATAKLSTLTQREREILRLLADGMRNEQVAQRLSISPLTVRTHVKHAMQKLEADTRTQAVASALRQSQIT